MKKIFRVLLLLVFLIPLTVKADMGNLKAYYNDKLNVNGELLVQIPFEYDNEYTFTIEYDKDLLETSKEMISINSETSFTLVDGEPKTVNNVKDVTIEDNKIIIKTKVVFPTLEGDAGAVCPELSLRFKALKEGKSTVQISAKSNNESMILINSPEVSIEGSTISVEESTNSNVPLYCSIGLNVVLLIALAMCVLKNKKDQ